MDFSSAYVNVDINVGLYIEQPNGFEIGKNKVCKPNKSLYDLKHAGKLWNYVLDNFLMRIVFKNLM